MKEIERKFLVNNAQIMQILVSKPSVVIKQGYLFDNKDTSQVMRVRLVDGNYLLTYKRALSSMECIEVEFPVSREKGKILYDECSVKLEKERFTFKCDINENLIWEVDVFKNHFSFQAIDDQLIIAECELQDRNSTEIILPAWIKEEVTNNYQYKNNQLVNQII